ncbi:MAG: GNAT family N-acetyltransferase [Thermoplasmata archaeon]|nr:GNAT family N-acetyltransferase [Thermoplasmata archaeon]
MEFKFYDEVDPEQVNLINLICHNEPAGARTIARIRRNDPFCSPWFRMYAVEGEKVVTQVGAQYPLIQTSDGKARAGFIEAVAGTPSLARKGYAKALMKRVHEQMLDDGIDVFVLTTSRILVAYDMYPKLGYHDMLPLSWAIKKWQKHPIGDVKVRVRKHPSEAEDAIFSEHVRGSLGFVRRPKNYPKLKCSWGPHYSDAVTFSRGDEQLGYALVRRPEGFLSIREMVCKNPADYQSCIKALENRFPSRYVTRSLMTRSGMVGHFRDAGFTEADTWGMFMAMDAKGKMSQKQVRALLGIDKDRFQMFTLDTY